MVELEQYTPQEYHPSSNHHPFEQSQFPIMAHHSPPSDDDRDRERVQDHEGDRRYRSSPPKDHRGEGMLGGERRSSSAIRIGQVDRHDHGGSYRQSFSKDRHGREMKGNGFNDESSDEGSNSPSYHHNPKIGEMNGRRHHQHQHSHQDSGQRRMSMSDIHVQRGFPLSPLSHNMQYREPAPTEHHHHHHQHQHHRQQHHRQTPNTSSPHDTAPHRQHQPPAHQSMNPLLHPSAHIYNSPPNQHQTPQGCPMSMPSQGFYPAPGVPSQIFGPAAGIPQGAGFLNPMQSMIPPQPNDYTTFSAMTGNQLETMPLASPHYPGAGGVGYPNAMPLCRSVEVLPGPGTYGHPRHPTFCKPDYRRFCFSVGKADVPYAAVGQVAPPLGMGGPFA